jgi:hypothetical protein
MDIPGRTLRYQSCTMEAVLPEFPESSPGFILFREVTDQNANAHYISFTHYVVWTTSHGEGFHVT